MLFRTYFLACMDKSGILASEHSLYESLYCQKSGKRRWRQWWDRTRDHECWPCLGSFWVCWVWVLWAKHHRHVSFFECDIFIKLGGKLDQPFKIPFKMTWYSTWLKISIVWPADLWSMNQPLSLCVPCLVPPVTTTMKKVVQQPQEGVPGSCTLETLVCRKCNMIPCWLEYLQVQIPSDPGKSVPFCSQTNLPDSSRTTSLSSEYPFKSAKLEACTKSFP